MTEERTAGLLRLLQLGIVLAVIWFQVPEHRRTAWRLAAWRTARVVCWRAARVTGRSAMTAELSGQGQRYGLPLTLASLARAAEAGYARTRGSLT